MISAPPAHISGSWIHSRNVVLAILLAGLVTSCARFLASGPEASGEASASASPVVPSAGGQLSPGACQPAPAWLRTALQNGLLVRGATLGEAFIGPASNFSSGPAAVMSGSFGNAWWAAARINGAGVRPENGLWLTDRTQAGASGEIFGANPTAVRYSEWGQGGSDPIVGEGSQAVLDCMTPIPES